MTNRAFKNRLLLGSCLWVLGFPALAQTPAPANFNRVATFEVSTNVPEGSDRAQQTVAEIIAASDDGRMLVYTDSDGKRIGFIDITDPARPRPAGVVSLQGEPTSVTIVGDRIYAAVDTSPSKDRPSGQLVTIGLSDRRIQATCELGGQPDSIAASRDRRFLAIAVENERDEQKDRGRMPQLPGGFLAVVGISADGADCAAKRDVALTGLAALFPEDPEPEFVDINSRNEAVVTLQENNHIALIDLATGRVTAHFSAGQVTLDKIDTKRDAIIAPVDRLSGIKREPDAVKWLDDQRFVTANEGDYEGGSRGFTIVRRDGTVEWDSGNSLEHLAIRIGHYPDRRSNAKGAEPEGIEVARFGNETLIFVAAERASFVAVYRDRGPGQAPEFVQVMPTGVGPEGLVAIPGRNLLAVAAEVDGRKDGRAGSTVMIYERQPRAADYPHIVSADRADGTPIPFGALSALASDRSNPERLYAITDSAYADTRILTLDVSQTPARIIAELPLRKDGKVMGYDAEGLVQRAGGGFFVATEGNPERKLKDMLLAVSADGSVQEEIFLPESLAEKAERFGFEGVAVTGAGATETVWLAVQREWKDDPRGHVKILSYKPATRTWGVLHYPLDQAKPGSWVGLSEIVAINDETFAVIERDNLFGDASLKSIKSFSIKGLTPAPLGSSTIPVVTKRSVRDLVPDIKTGGGYVLDKVEGLTITSNGMVFAVTDNDGVDGSNGETRLLRLGRLAFD